MYVKLNMNLYIVWIYKKKDFKYFVECFVELVYIGVVI